MARPAANISSLVVRQVKSEQRCKLCKTPHRAEIDQLLLLRSNRAVLDDGTPVNANYVRAKALELGVENPTHENFTSHWKNHCQVVDRNDEEEIAAAVESVLGELTPDELRELTAADRLELLEIQGMLELQARLKRTGKTGITIDQLIRINELKQRQKSNEDQRRFLGALGAGLTAAIGGALRKELPPAHPDLEAEVVIEPEGVVET